LSTINTKLKHSASSGTTCTVFKSGFKIVACELWHYSAIKAPSFSLHFLFIAHSFAWFWNLHASESRSETPGKAWNVVLEKTGEDKLDRLCQKHSVTKSQEGEKYPTYDTRKEN